MKILRNKLINFKKNTVNKDLVRDTYLTVLVFGYRIMEVKLVNLELLLMIPIGEVFMLLFQFKKVTNYCTFHKINSLLSKQ